MPLRTPCLGVGCDEKRIQLHCVLQVTEAELSERISVLEGDLQHEKQVRVTTFRM